MQKLKCKVNFNTPAFLGGAEQQGQWRTPPFKALIRQWWRMVYAAERKFTVDVNAMRADEGKLFGCVGLEDGRDNQMSAWKSKILIRLDRWDEGRIKRGNNLWGKFNITHPEITRQIDSSLYLGYGPLTMENKRTSLKYNASIQEGEVATLSLAVPESEVERIQKALWLMDRYGTLGGRSRNGWGSFSLKPHDEHLMNSGFIPLSLWTDSLTKDWPHAIGIDDQGNPLIWRTKPFKKWEELMRELAIVKISLRTQFLFQTGENANKPEERHWLSYPVTNHSVKSWNNKRLPNSLRFKVRKLEDGTFVGVIFHVPCSPPAEFNSDLKTIKDVWGKVHALLDELTKTDIDSRKYLSIEDKDRLAVLKPNLKDIVLQKIPE